MNTKMLSLVFTAVLAVFMLSFTSAVTFVDQVVVNVDGVTVNGNDFLGTSNGIIELATFAGETIPVRVFFTANDTAKDVKVKVEISSGTRDYSDSYFVGNVFNDNRTYRTGYLNVRLPSSLDDLNKTLYLRVTITADGLEPYVKWYVLKIQREAYKLGVLSLDYDMTVSAGDVVPVSVVVKNRGFQDSDDGFVIVSIPELGVSAKAYLGDLVAIESCIDGCDETDAIQKVLQLRIPASAKSGVYDVVAKINDYETVTTVTSIIEVSASSSTQIVAAVKSQDMKAGQTMTYELILVNSADKVGVYNLKAVSGSELSVSVPSVVTVDAGSSKVVPVTVTVSRDADKGVYPFTVEANGQSIVLNSNVTGVSASVYAIVLTVILVIVFIALLVALVVLLLRKDKPATEEVETSYY